MHFLLNFRAKACYFRTYFSTFSRESFVRCAKRKGKQYLCLTILAAAALREEERGEAEDGEDERADNHGYGEVQIGTGLAGAFSEYGYG